MSFVFDIGIRSEGEGHRVQRLATVLAKIQFETDAIGMPDVLAAHLRGIADHKGTLTIEWNQDVPPEIEEIIIATWAEENECHIRFVEAYDDSSSEREVFA